MTFNQFKKIVLANKDKYGITCWCANCGTGLMYAPIEDILKPGGLKKIYDFCFAYCTGCKMANPPLYKAEVFSEEEFRSIRNETWNRSYFKKRNNSEEKSAKKWYD